MKLLRQNVTLTDWDACFDDNISCHAQNFIGKLLLIIKECIPNKTVTIRPTEPPWLTKRNQNEN